MLLRSHDAVLEEEAARLLGRWQLDQAFDPLADLARTGTHNGRIAAMVALRKMTSPEAVTAVERLRGQIEKRWQIYLG